MKFKNYQQLMKKHNPLVSQVLDKDIFTFEDKLALADIDFRIAFTFEGYLSREIKNDPRYVKYLVRIFGIHEGEEYEHILPYHLCTDEDWE